MKYTMLWTGEYDREGYEEFSKYFDIKLYVMGVKDSSVPLSQRLDGKELIDVLQDVDVYMCGYEKITEEIIKNCPKLKLILSVRDGPEENIDLKACEKYGIPVLSSAGRCSVSVAELTFALMLNLARPIIKMTNHIMNGGWTKEDAQVTRKMYDDFSIEIFGKTVGIIGLGRNGYRVAQYSKAFDAKVIAYDPYVNKEKMEKEGISIVDLDTLMKTSDFVVVLARLTDTTKGMVSREKIEMMKSEAVLINTGRGALVDNEALMDALENDKIRGAAIDAHIIEPLDINSRERKINPNKLILTPHMAGKTAERNWHQCQLLLKQYEDYLKGNIERFPLTPKVGESDDYEQRGKILFGIEK